MSENMKRFLDDMKENKEMKEKYEALLVGFLAENKALSETEAIVKAASALGYDVTAAQIERYIADREEVDVDALDRVAGGAETDDCTVSYSCNMAFLHPDTGENAPAPRYSVFNVNDETLIQMDDPSVSGAVQTIAAAQEKPWFAVSYDNGYIYFFDMEKREAVELSGYSIGEILTLGFSEDDQYLAVLLSDGPIDLYSTDTLKQKCRITTDTMGSLDSDSEAYSSDYRNGSAFRFFATLTDDETMFLAVAPNNSNTAGCVVIDLTGETTRSEIGDVYAADLENGKLYTRRGKKLIRYPVYSRKDLIEWAGRGWLAAPEETEK